MPTKEETKNLIRGFPFHSEGDFIFFESDGEMFDLALIERISYEVPDPDPSAYDPGDTVVIVFHDLEGDSINVEYPYKPATFKEEMLGLFKVFAQVRSKIKDRWKEKRDEG